MKIAAVIKIPDPTGEAVILDSCANKVVDFGAIQDEVSVLSCPGNRSIRDDFPEHRRLFSSGAKANKNGHRQHYPIFFTHSFYKITKSCQLNRHSAVRLPAGAPSSFKDLPLLSQDRRLWGAPPDLSRAARRLSAEEMELRVVMGG
ncbi:hypothetical protein ACQ86N_30255 [Puia sp. P3]|uniref:hypothetical protein n=1 Tax=Puia sp. P3 TaxID=3423952 RepID=UPI003D66959A